MGDAGSIEFALAAAIASLHSANRRFALVGGLAVSVRAEVRFTREVDLAVEVDRGEDLEGKLAALLLHE